MKLSENRKLAFVVLAVVILFSILVQGSIALQNKRGDIEEVFMTGELHDNVIRCADQAEKVSQMGGVYLAEGVLESYCGDATAKSLTNGGYVTAIQQLEPLAKQLRDAPDPNSTLAVLKELSSNVEKAYTGIDMLDLTDAQKRDIKLAYYDYTGALDLIARNGDEEDSYAKKAAEFNGDLDGFPASVIASVLKIAPLTIYGG